MRVYVITEGEYSAYHIVAVFTDEAKKDAYMAFQPPDEGDGIRVKEFESDTAIINDIPQGHRVYNVHMDIHGVTTHIENIPVIHNEHRNIGWSVYNYLHKEGNEFLLWRGIARSEQHAIKIVNELRVRLIALNSFNHGITSDNIGVEI